MPSGLRRGRALRTVARTAAALSVILLVLGALVSIAPRHPRVRAELARWTNRALQETWRGRLSVTGVEAIGPRGLSGVAAELQDETGHELARVEGLAVDLNVLSLLWQVMFSKGPLTLDIRQLGIARGEVWLVESSDASLTLTQALEPRATLAPSTQPGARRSVRLRLASIHVDDLWIHGRWRGVPPFDALLSAPSGGLTLDDGELRYRLVQTHLREANLTGRGPIDGELSSEGRIPLGERAPDSASTLTLGGRFDGSVAGLPATLTAHYAEPRLDAVLDVPSAAPSAVKNWLPLDGLRQPLSLSLRVEGALPQLSVHARAALGGARLDADGPLVVSPALGATLTLKAEALDLAELFSAAPSSALHGEATLQLHFDDGPVAALDFRVADSTLASRVLPPLRGRAEWAHDALRGTASVAEAGTLAQLTFELGPPRASATGPRSASNASLVPRPVDELPGAMPEGVPSEPPRRTHALRPTVPTAARRVLQLEIDGTFSDLAALCGTLRLPTGLTGQARIQGTGWLGLDATPDLDATFSVTGTRLRQRGIRLAQLHGDVHARGALRDPRIDVRARGRAVVVSTLAMPVIELDATGSLHRLELRAQIDAGHFTSARLTARLDATSGELSDLRLSLAREGGRGATLTAAAIAVGQQGVRVDRLRLRGAGALDVSGRLGASGGRLDATGTDVDLGALSTLLGLPPGVSGQATFEASLGYDGQGRSSGDVTASTTRLTLPGVPAASLSASVHLQRGLATGQLGLAVDRLGQMTIRLHDLMLATDQPVSAAELLSSTGTWELEATLDLATLAEQLRDSVVSRWQPGGTLRINAQFARQPSRLPDLSLEARTEGLRWSSPSASAGDAIAAAERTADTHSRPADAGRHTRALPGARNIELDLALHLFGERGRAELELEAVAGRDAIVKVIGHGELPVARLLEDPRALRPCEWPFALTSSIPQRSLDTLPLPVPARGQGQLEATLVGPLSAPSLDLALDVRGLSLPAGGRDANVLLPMDVAVHGHYRRDHLEIESEVKRRGAQILTVALDALTEPGAAIVGCGGGRAVSLRRASARLTADRFPLQALGFFGQRQIAGDLSGSADLDRAGGSPHLTADLAVEALRVGRQNAPGRVTLGVTSDGAQLDARAELLQPDGRARASARGELAWPGVFTPSFRPRTLDVDARNFDLANLRPWLTGALGTLGGRADARLTLRTDAALPGLQGAISLRQGTIQVPALGQRLSNIGAQIEVNRGDVTLRDASADGFTGRIQAQGSGHLEGLRLASARLRVHSNKGEAIPITLQGVPLGQAWGELALDAERPAAGAAWSMRITAPALHVETPDEPLHGVQSLEADPAVLRGVFLDPEHFVPLLDGPMDAGNEPGSDAASPPLHVRVELGRDVWLQRGTMANVQLEGTVEADVGAQLLLDGRLLAHHGKLVVQGKVFQIQDGSVTFQRKEQPTNPTVVATAAWDSPERIRVFADYVGPVETGKLTLRSEPPLTNNEILSLLLFGSADGPVATTGTGAKPEASGSIGSTALAASAGVISGGLNRALARLTTLDIQTRIGEHQGSPLPEVALQLTPRLSAEVAYALGTPLPGQSPDRTFVTLDLRLFSNWSLSSSVGDQGSTLLDLLWRYRY